MEAGNDLRRRTRQNDALVMLGIGAIRERRQTANGDPNSPMAGHAHILHSLKRPEEVETLRRIYGPAFHVLSAYSHRSRRVEDLARRIAQSRHSNQLSEYLPKAEALLARDESESDDKHGQDVRKIFPLADVIVDTSNKRAMASEIHRFVELLFGNTFHTPKRDEEGMYYAYAAALRSASLARQVGAAICRSDGSLVAVGTNEVAESGGGQYWCESANDGRDFLLGHDSSDRMRENLLGDIIQRLMDNAWLAVDKSKMPVSELVKIALHGEEGSEPIMRGRNSQAPSISSGPFTRRWQR